MSDCGYTPNPPQLWAPEPLETRNTNMDKLRARIENKYHVTLHTYKELHEWSTTNYSEFWEEFWHFSDIVHSKSYDEVVDKTKNISEIPEWFAGSRLNFAENLLRYRDDRIAIHSIEEGWDAVRSVTFSQLYSNVERLAAAMRSAGIGSGDRIVGYLPNGVEAVVAMLATASIGAVWSSTSPDFGVSGVLDRFTQVQPQILFSINAVVYNGKVHNHLDKLEQVVQGLPDLKKVVIVANQHPMVKASASSSETCISRIRNSYLYSDFERLGCQADGVTPTQSLEFTQLPFNHPLFIMFSSGTTGAPKCMVHSAGGTLMKHLEEHIIQSNMTRSDVLMYYTTTGWMMWNWYVSALAVGSSIVCYDGSPLVPHVNVLWDLVDKLKITILGTGAKWLSVLEERAVVPRSTHSLATLHTILVTGSPVRPQTFEFVYRDIKPSVLFGSITGGTDIIACFAGNNWTVPVYRGEIQGWNLGCAMDSWNEDGKSVLGESGELVCLKPFPSMPVFFLNDPDGMKYRKAYFAKYPGVWAHGDYCLVNPTTRGLWMLGRSDGTLNPGGVRFGSAEIYHVVDAFKDIQDSLCVGQRSTHSMDERVVLFVKMAPGATFGLDLVKQIQASIRGQLSARHVPSAILEIADIPYTHSGKKVEVAVKKILCGEEVKDRGSYANPNSLDLYYNIPQLQDF